MMFRLLNVFKNVMSSCKAVPRVIQVGKNSK